MSWLYFAEQDAEPVVLSAAEPGYVARPTLPVTPLSQPAETVVRLKTLGETWEVTGRDRFPGVIPESVEFSFNEWGADQATFILRRDTNDLHVDLSAFTDVEIEIGGVLVWEGRVRDTPEQGGSAFQVTVQAEGWQYHLDDDPYEAIYVHTNTTDWVDVRSLVDADQNVNRQNGTVQLDGGTMRLAFPQNSVIAAGNVVGVMFDAGPNSLIKRVAVDATSDASFAFIGANMIVAGSDGPYWGTGRVDFIGGTATPNGTYAGTVAAGKRYVSLLMYNPTVNGTMGADAVLSFTGVRLFVDTAYESGNVSVLRAHHVVRDVIDKGTKFINRTDVVDSTFDIPDYAPDSARTPREHLTAINAYENRRLMVGFGKRLKFEPKPDTAALTSGPGAVFDDVSGSSSEDIVNKVAVEATGPDGAAIRVVRYAGQQAGVPLDPITSPAPDNPSFASGTTSWTPSGSGTITADALHYDSSPQSGRWANGAVGDTLTETFTGTFVAGQLYVLKFAISVGTAYTPLDINFGHLSSGDYTRSPGELIEAVGFDFFQHSIAWVPTVDRTGVTFQLRLLVAGRTWRVDSLQLYQARPTLADRRGFLKSKVLTINSKITALVGARFGDLYLTEARRTPTKGTLSAPPGGLVVTTTGENVRPANVGYYIQEQVRLPGEIDPDTGGIGRDVRVVGGSYSAATGTGQLQLDATRGNFQALLSRYAVITGGAN